MSSINSSINPTGSSTPAVTTGTDAATSIATSSVSVDTTSGLTSGFSSGLSSSGSSTTTATTSASNPILNPPQFITLSEFTLSTLKATDDNTNQQYSQELQNILATKNMHLNAALTAAAYSALFSQLMALGTEESGAATQLNNATDTLNTVINSVNSQIASTQVPPGADEAAITAMNNAIQKYNAGTITQDEFNNAVQTYNNYVTARDPTLQPLIDQLNAAISQYNTAVTQYNNALPDINAQREAFGLSAIPLQPLLGNYSALPTQQGSPPLQIPISLVPDEAEEPLVADVPAPTFITLMNQVFNASFDAQLTSSNSLSAFVTMLTNHRDFVNFFLKGRLKSLPNSYIDPQVQAQFSTSGGPSTMSGVSLSTLATGLSNSHLSGILSNAIYKQAVQNLLSDNANVLGDNSSTPDVSNSLNIYEYKILTLVSLNAGSQSTRLLAGQSPTSAIDIGSSPIAVSLGHAFANQISRLIADDRTSEAVRGFVQQSFSGFSNSQQENLANTLIAGLNLSLLQSGVSVAEQTLGIPGLSASLAHNVSGLPDIKAIYEAEGIPLTDVLSNQVSVANLASDLSQQLVAQDNTQTTSRANSIANLAISNTLKQGINNEDDLKTALQNQLIKNGVNASNAQNLSQRAADYANAEKQGLNLLDLTVNPNLLNGGNLQTELSKAGLAVSSTVVQQILNTTIQSQRQLRDKIAEQVKTEGVQQRDALFYATKAVVGNETLTTELQSKEALANSIVNKTTQALAPTLGHTQAQKIGNDFANTLLGSSSEKLAEDRQNPNSILNQMTEQVKTLTNLHNDKINQAIYDSNKSFQAPNTDLSAFVKKLLDPANDIIYSNATGIMYQHDVPGEKKFLSVPM